MIELQLLTGMRPGEVVLMRLCDIDRTQQPWLYRPSRHKTAQHGHDRVVFLGPKAQELILPFIDDGQPARFLFSPSDADRNRRDEMHRRRVTPLSCGNRPGTNRKGRPKKRPGERYTTHSYGRAIKYACQSAFPTPEGLDEARAKEWRASHCWHPHQLRHNAATQFRKEYGLDVAQVVLGHKTLAVTQVYAERNEAMARETMAKCG